MAVKYLSNEWARELTDALNASDSIRSAIAGVEATVQLNVTGGPDGDVSYYNHFDGTKVTVGIGTPPVEPDAQLTMPYLTATQVASGVITGQSAMAGGKAQASGNIAKVMVLSGAMQEAQEIESDLDVEF